MLDIAGSNRRIAVCIKQVPATQISIGRQETRQLDRQAGSAILNPHDAIALETALQLKDSLGCRVVAISMGPPYASTILRQAIALGADEGILLSDPVFAAADVLATSYTLAQGITSTGPYDLIICGRQSTDGDTGQLGPALAAQLDLPYACCVEEIVAEPPCWKVSQAMTHQSLVQRLPSPSLAVVHKNEQGLRPASLAQRLRAQRQPISVLTLAALPDSVAEHYGYYASPTQVERVYQPRQRRNPTLQKGEATKLARSIVSQWEGK
ncbi:hypothetical protein RJ45_13330 [Photobacterium gaetbulicola]|uniref:Electron transfer flavoprotein alpha/beta-subunit N-terminal domain-containing protein n=1 Tax=Photobacterium gaetbulicola TaxID=1295392 RepID=A0A0B9G417_9GAMM|nr:electron transfer flavoprotein subunit beta/FixA family protein [Photobacterium gaetbulicola]KHT63364.1 hypothetical protein RJ45_13330 [Photobacterium gaetbulicola]